jgi:hypothetical protein
METNKKILGKINTQRCSVTLTYSLLAGGRLHGKVEYRKQTVLFQNV